MLKKKLNMNKRLKDLFLIESLQNNYRINENESLEAIFEEKIKRIKHDKELKEKTNGIFSEGS